MARIARILGLGMLFVFFSRPVIVQQLVSQQIIGPPSAGRPFEHTLCIWTLPPCADDGTCRAHGFVSVSPTTVSPVRMEVRFGRRPNTAKRPGVWHVWGYVIDETGKQYKTLLWYETTSPCIDMMMRPTSTPDTVLIRFGADPILFQTRRRVPGMGSQPYVSSRMGVWVEGSEPPPEEDLYVEALYPERQTRLGTLREQGLLRDIPFEEGPEPYVIVPFISPGPGGNS